MTTEELIQHMNADLFVANLSATDKEGVLAELTDTLATPARINDRDLMLDMLRNREALGSTAVGNGVAFPHGRSLAISRLTILVARSKKGCDFDSMDGKPTHLFFLLVAPPQDTGNVYLQALGAITGLVAKDDVRNALLEAESFDDIVNILREGGA